MEKIIKQDNEVMKILKVNVIQRVVCHTDKGILTLQIRKGDTKYHLVLDAVPLDKDDNKELMDMLFPAKALEVPQVNKLAKDEIELCDLDKITIVKVGKITKGTFPALESKKKVTKKK